MQPGHESFHCQLRLGFLSEDPSFFSLTCLLSTDMSRETTSLEMDSTLDTTSHTIPIRTMAKLEFISSDPASCLKPGKSLQIRSHCMQGKNSHPDSRRAVRNRKRQVQGEAKERGAARPGLQLSVQPEPSTVCLRSTDGNKQVIERAYTAQTTSLLSLRPDDLALVSFADISIELEAKQILLHAFADSVCDQRMTPLERCLDLNCIEAQSFKHLFTDRAFLQSVLCTEYALRDHRRPGGLSAPGCKTALHLHAAVSLLQDKITSPDNLTDESIIYVVINLALAAMTFGDWPAAAAHLKGLHRITQLRGGLDFLASRPSLCFKLDRWE
jgi:hypothetical protein